jgi:hypothetical protein
MDYVGVTEIPSKHILKRWTRDARDVLPDHLRHYQRDQVKGKEVTYRHCSLYIMAMELVRLGDSSADAYEKCAALFKENLVALAPYENQRDGLGLEYRLTGCVQKRAGSKMEIAEDGDRNGDNTNPLCGLAPPCKKLKAGRPSTSRDKAPYEESGKRSRFCSICKKPSHKRTTCPDRGDQPKQPRKEPRCSRCGVAGHRKSTCMKHL